MGNRFDQFDVVNDPADNPDAPKYNRFDQFDGEQFSVGRDIAEPVNRGVLGMLDFPVNLANAGIAFLDSADRYIAKNVWGREPNSAPPPQLTAPFTEAGRRLGVVAPPEEQRHGFVPRVAEFTGAGIFPAAGLISYGRMALADLAPVPTALQQMGRAAATSPGKMTAFDLAANFTAASGGEVARKWTDNETIIAMAELGSAFLPTAAFVGAKALPTGRLYNRVSDWTLESLAPFTKAGATVAASRRLQSVAADPQATASALDLDSPVPPMQQSGDPGILKLQDIILKHNPAMRAEWSEELRLAIDQIVKSASIPGGDVGRAVHLLNIRQQMAVEEAAAAVNKLGSGGTPREISVAARRAASAALDDATALEGAIWNRLDMNAPADIENAAVAMSEILARRSLDANPEDIPKWLMAKMSGSPIDADLLSQLQKQGYADADGNIDPAIMSALEKQGLLQTRQRTLNDVKELRSRVLQEIRDEKAAQGRGPNRRKLSILNDVQVALLEDMTATGVPGIDEARAFSNALNQRFRSGRVGRLLGYDTTGLERVSEEDFLHNIVYGEASATNSKLFGEMANEAPELTLSFIRAKYLESVVNESGTVSQTAHKAFITGMKKKGMFDIYPELEGELNRVAKLGAQAAQLDVPQSQINTTRLNNNQSRAALLLQAHPGEEMSLVLKSKNPAGAIQDVMKTKIDGAGKILASDRGAVLGLQDSFVEEIFTLASRETADGVMVVQGKNLKVLLDKYKTVMQSLHMGDQQIARLNGIAERLRVAQLGISTEVDVGSTMLDSGLKAPVEYLARIIGARYGAQLGGSGGGSIQTASIASSAVKKKLESITRSEAEKLLTMAVNDGELYRALLRGPTVSKSAEEKAFAVIDAAINKIQRNTVSQVSVQATQENE